MKINNLAEKLITLCVVLCLVVAMYLLDIRCFFKLLFGISCPGCGITRACISILKLNFAEAFHYNPMVLSVPVLVLLYLFDGKLFRQKWLNVLTVTGIISGFFICWIVRLIIG